MKPVRFTRHAFLKTIERLTLGREEIASIIDRELTIPIGYERGTNRIHLLFYSIKDKLCFVIIFDDKTREVVTVLPADYHHRWVIDTRLKEKAREIVVAGKKFEVSPAFAKMIRRREKRENKKALP